MDKLPPLIANPHFLRIGGASAVTRLVDAFYRAMDTEPAAATIRAMHAADLTATKQRLALYLGEWMGGPKQYSALHGAPMLRRRHQPFDIDADASSAWLLCMRRALDEACTDAALRQELDTAFSKLAEFLRNTESQHPHSHHREKAKPS